MSAPAIASYMTDRIGPLPFCPGCGHTTLTHALDKALVKLQLDPRRVVVVTDIGCIGLSDRYFTTHAFHGLHGRSITYACGLKLARPELKVITLMGDGAAGIGGAHFLNVARRNIGITLLVGNNFNYGMTGGQHSVTTPEEGLTSSTPAGNPEAPMDLCATAAAAGAPWVWRATMFDPDLPDVIADAISQPGFAMVDVWELCTAYYMPRNQFKKKELLEMFGAHGLTTGLVADRPRPEYTARNREVAAAAKPREAGPAAVEPRFRHAMKRQTGIVVAGSAGQKIKSSAALFAQGGMFAGLQATQKDDYPITVQTGHSVAEVNLSPERIDYTGIERPDLFVLLSEDGLRRTRETVAALPASSTLYAVDDLELPATAARVRRLPSRELTKDAGRLSLCTAALAFLLADSGLYPVEALRAAITAFSSPKIAESGLKAADAGAAAVHRE